MRRPVKVTNSVLFRVYNYAYVAQPFSLKLALICLKEGIKYIKYDYMNTECTHFAKHRNGKTFI